MMETSLWAAALCALLLVNSGSADDTGAELIVASPTSSIAPGTEASPVAHAAESEPDPTVHLTDHALNNSDPNPALNGTSSSNNDTMTSPEVAVVTSTPEKRVSPTTQPQPPHPTSADPPAASHTPDSTTIISPMNTAHTFSAEAAATKSSDYNTSQSTAPALPDSSSDRLNRSQTVAPTPAPASESPKQEHTSASLSTRPTPASSTTLSHQHLNFSPSTHALSPDSHHKTTAKAQVKSSTTTTTTTTTTTKLASGPSSQANTQTNNPSQLNVGNDPTVVHDSPMLDPLLAGLVSAFIITAVIITLLLFLKLRRRDNRPEFRRLQDLPMDDMMEDTPLSMYSY
ncbi:unnamed protein product [Ophioblennius macclurei]